MEFRSGGELGPTVSAELPRGSCRSVQDFMKSCRIGEGTYGTVYRATDKTTGQVVALKRVILHNEKAVGFPITSLREIRLLKRLSHTNCVALLDVAVGNGRDAVFLVFEYCEHDLASLCEHGKRFSESEAKGLMVQLLRAVEYLHDQWIVHRDLKLSNLLYNSRGQLKLADFGLARLYSMPARPMTPKVLLPVCSSRIFPHVFAIKHQPMPTIFRLGQVVTLWYRAPELLLGSTTYGPPVDLWAAGSILGELIHHAPLMPGKTEPEQISLIFALLGTPTEDTWPELPQLPGSAVALAGRARPCGDLPERFMDFGAEGVSFLGSLLEYNPDRRLTARQALQHDFFKSRPYPQKAEFMPTFPTRHGSTTAHALDSSLSRDVSGNYNDQRKRPRVVL